MNPNSFLKLFPFDTSGGKQSQSFKNSWGKEGPIWNSCPSFWSTVCLLPENPPAPVALPLALEAGALLRTISWTEVQLERERAAFLTATVEPIWQLRDDLRFRLADEGRGPSRPCEADLILQQVRTCRGHPLFHHYSKHDVLGIKLHYIFSRPLSKVTYISESLAQGPNGE